MKIRHFGWLVATVIVGVIVYGAILIRRGFSTRDEPSRIEAWTARRVRHLAMPSDAKALKNPIPSSLGAIREGMHHYADHCAICHANDGSGETEIGRKLYPKAPDMRAAGTQNLSDGEIYYIIQNGVRLSGMPAWGKARDTNDEESWKLVQFIRHLPSLTASEQEHMKQMNPSSPQDQESNREEQDFLSGSSDTKPHNH